MENSLDTDQVQPFLLGLIWVQTVYKHYQAILGLIWVQTVCKHYQAMTIQVGVRNYFYDGKMDDFFFNFLHKLVFKNWDCSSNTRFSA